MRIALIGAAGQLGTDLRKLLPDAASLTHAQIEITDAASIGAALDSLQPECVINTAAYNLVDQAEDDPERAFSVNATGPEQLARWCQKSGAILVHISTDYVFGADLCRQQPYHEEDQPGPISVYGRSKLAGEEAVQTYCQRAFIIRTCGLYGEAATRSKGNFVKTMLRLAGERDELRVVNDQRCTPSYTVDVARMILGLLQTNEFGLYHVTNSGAATWYEVACEAIRLRGLTTPVIPIPSSEYPTKAKRPGYSVLNCEKAERVTGIQMPHWTDALARYVAIQTPR